MTFLLSAVGECHFWLVGRIPRVPGRGPPVPGPGPRPICPQGKADQAGDSPETRRSSTRMAGPILARGSGEIRRD